MANRRPLVLVGGLPTEQADADGTIVGGILYVSLSQTYQVYVGPVSGKAGLILGSLADTNLYRSAAAALQTDGTLAATALIASGLTGAVQATRFVGGTTAGAPTSGTFAVGDFVISQDGRVIICTTAGTPGTWKAATDVHNADSTAHAMQFNNQTGTAYTTVLSDGGKTVEGNNASAITHTIPPNSSVAYPVGTQMFFYQQGAGQIALAAGAGVTLRIPNGGKTAKQYSVICATKRATDEWVVSGDCST